TKPWAWAQSIFMRAGGVTGVTICTSAISRASRNTRSSALSSNGRSGTMNPVTPARVADSARRSGVTGFIVPDLPFDESAELRVFLDARDIALVQMVTPVTPPARMKMLCAHAQGFVYAVTMTGTTGKNVSVPAEV